MTSDIRFALRQIARTPLFSGVVIGVIALGIGTNAGLLTTLNTYAWRPAPGIPADARLARLTAVAEWGKRKEVGRIRLSYPDILDLREQRDVFSDVAAFGASDLAVDLGSGAEAMRVSYVTDNFFRTLRVRLAVGAGLPEGGERSSAPIAVLDHALWISNFSGSPDVIGKTIRVMNRPFTIVGVAPPHFSGVDVAAMGQPTIWLPLGTRAELEPDAADDLTRRDALSLRTVARLAPGVSASDVGRLSTMVAARIAQQDPESHGRLAIRAEPLTGISGETSERTETVAAFLLVAALVVVITCTNVSALLLGRAVSRRREIAVRLSLGATRLRVVRQMLTESLVYALAGALLGLLLYAVVIKIAYATIPEVILGLEPQLATFAFAALFALATTIAFGLAPALHATRTGVGEAMKNSGTLAIRRARIQATFVVIQLAFSQPALVVAALVLADVRAKANDNADKAPASVVTMTSELIRPASRDTAQATRATLDAIQRRLAIVPGVQAVALGTSGQSQSFQVPGEGAVARVRQSYVTPGFFATRGIPLVRGRAIGADDDHRGSIAVVVNEAAATRLWPGENPIGRRVIRSDDATTLEVIGVVGRPVYEGDEVQPELYVAMANANVWQDERRSAASSNVNRIVATLVIAVRTTGDARPFVPQIRAAIREVEPYATVDNVTTLAERYASRRREAHLTNLAAFAVGTVALVLASLGLYAIIAFAVAQRTREIGLRMAVGATSSDVVRHFFRSGITVTAIGLAIGLPLTVAGVRVVESGLIGFTFRQVAPVLLVVPVLIGVAALASWLPARRAGRVDPLVALRSE